MKSYHDTYWKVLQGFDDKDILNRLTGNQNDETLQNFIKRKHPKKEREKRNKGQGPKSRQASCPNKAGHKEKREPLRTQPSTNRMEDMNNQKTRPKKM
jgi:hypothetical protein